MAKCIHLLNRNGYYYFRLVVPQMLKARIGRKELTYSLKTKNYHTAKTRCMYVLCMVHSLFEQIEKMKTLTRDEIKLYIGRYIQRHIESLDSLTFRPDEYQDNAKRIRAQREQEQGYDSNEMISALEELTVNSPAVVMRDVCLENKINPKDLSPAHRPLLVQAVGRIYEEIENLRNQYASGALDISLQDTYLKDALDYANTQTAPAQMIELDQSSHDETILLSEAYETYLGQLKEKSLRSINKRRASLDFWLEIMGDTPLGQMDKAKIRNFLSTLQKLPSNRKKHYPDMSIEDLLKLKLPNSALMKNSTINDHLSPLSSFMNFAVTRYELPYQDNPFSGMNLNKTQAADELRDPFSEEQLQALFSSPVYKGCKGHRAQARYTAGKKIIQDSIYWVPLIGLYSGMRMNEILQLYMSDIYEVEGVWVFDVNEDGDDKKLKNKGSRRIIPIHPKIVELGFVEYMQTVKDKGETRIFYDAEISSDGTYSNRFSKKFSNLLKRYDVKTDRTSFHSFRHNVTDVLRFSEDVDDETSNHITGHTLQGVKARYGGKRTAKMQLLKHIPKLAAAMKHIQYPCLDGVWEEYKSN